MSEEMDHSKFSRFFLGCLQANTMVQAAVAAIQIRRMKLLYLAVSFAILVLGWISAATGAWVSYNVILNTSPSLWNDTEVSQRFYSTAVNATHLVASPMQRWIGDALLVYRCFIFWRDHLWIAGVPVMIYVVNLAISIRTLIPLSANFTGENFRWQAADIFIFVTLHIVITSLISYRLVKARQWMSRSVKAADDKVYTNVIAMLVESAAILTVVGAGYAVSSAIWGNWTAYRVKWFFYMGYSSMIALAPQMIIFRVAIGTSWVKRPENWGQVPTTRIDLSSGPKSFHLDTKV
ncbi:hypothetical protein CC1G_09249 [Coprinopsis cinerea okayama7|uniref:Integral membrane protein n=1 Tax=Coprinopsis cinerea (strain Okayama-7 / 130 / ATCC MYA-4618 / FGSC 9003) TaxID=240176 RepID=A8P544_COPC7|nr:hypothetical protein CC1G_09249 [Coprinopsis cinerea okayama7\|eukprot:XP_001838872.2 hypothetical protein CC1G_09249 [Coprinopsis cinerea okayama7\